jgi:acyl-homoserine-lactone acylase
MRHEFIGVLDDAGCRRHPRRSHPAFAWMGYEHYEGSTQRTPTPFGPRVHARAVTAGGESGDPASPHFNDEAGRYASGDLREVYFYREQLKGHTERHYRP